VDPYAQILKYPLTYEPNEDVSLLNILAFIFGSFYTPFFPPGEKKVIFD
jgi:hypothetical protein